VLAITTGELYDAATAGQLGLVDIVVPRPSFDEAWRALADKMAGTAPGTTRAVKSVVAAAAPGVHPDLEAAATDTFARLWTSDAHWAAVDALTRAKTR
jgi:enoyl-CoA hydratase/carnithine racemase